LEEGIGVGERLLMMFEHAVYAVATEACACILWKIPARLPMQLPKIRISKLRDSRPPCGTLGGAHSDPQAAAILQAGAAAERMKLSQMNEQQRRECGIKDFREAVLFFAQFRTKVLVRLRARCRASSFIVLFQSAQPNGAVSSY